MAGLLVGCGTDELTLTVPDPVDPVFYEVEILGAPSDTVENLAEESLSLFRQQDDGAPSLAFLRGRAEGDIPVLQSVLRSRGFILPEITVDVREPEEEGTRALVTVTIVPGERFTLARHGMVITGGDPEPAARDVVALGSPVGGRAIIADILAAEDAAVASLQREGYAYARFVERDSLADPEAATLDVVSEIEAGRLYRFGPVRFEGVTEVSEDYLRSYIHWNEGEIFNGSLLRDFQRSLAGTQLFTSVSVERPELPPEEESLPVLVRVEERPPRTLSVGIRLNTDLGAEFGTSVVHRNLFGRNEQAGIRTTLNEQTQILGLDYRIPQFGRDGQDLVARAEYVQTDEDAFKGEVGSIFLGLERVLDDRWRVGVGGLITTNDVTDNGVKETSLLLGLPVFAEYDSTRDRFDPRNGSRARFSVTPFAGDVGGSGESFVQLDGTISFYRRLDDKGAFILATRARVASVLADGVSSVPKPQRLYAGGGGSVRGFDTDSIGPVDGVGDPQGGLSAIEAGAEVRLRFTDTFGAAGFVETGMVDDDPVPDSAADFRTAIGAGLRYFSPVGPIRADIAVPLEQRAGEDDFQFYLSVGQAF